MHFLCSCVSISLLKPFQNKRGQNFPGAPFSQLPAVKKDAKNGAPGFFLSLLILKRLYDPTIEGRFLLSNKDSSTSKTCYQITN